MRDKTPEEIAAIPAKKNIAQLLGEKGDCLFFKHEGETARVFNALAEGIAVLAHAPGGVKAFGRHWCAGPANPDGKPPFGANPYELAFTVKQGKPRPKPRKVTR